MPSALYWVYNAPKEVPKPFAETNAADSVGVVEEVEGDSILHDENIIAVINKAAIETFTLILLKLKLLNWNEIITKVIILISTFYLMH